MLQSEVASTYRTHHNLPPRSALVMLFMLRLLFFEANIVNKHGDDRLNGTENLGSHLIYPSLTLVRFDGVAHARRQVSLST